MHKLCKQIDFLSSRAKTRLEAETELARTLEKQRKQETSLGEVVKEVWDEIKTGTLKDNFKRLENLVGDQQLEELQDDLLLHANKGSRHIDRAPIFRRTLLRSLGNLRSFGWVVAVIILVIGGVIAVSLDVKDEQVLQLSKTIGEIVAVIGSASAWLGSALRRASTSISAVEEFESKLHAQLEQKHKKNCAM